MMDNLDRFLTQEGKSVLMSILEPFFQSVADEVISRIKGEEPKYYNRQELAKLLHVSLPTIHNLMNRGVIIPKRVGKKVLFSQDEIRESIAHGELSKYDYDSTIEKELSDKDLFEITNAISENCSVASKLYSLDSEVLRKGVFEELTGISIPKKKFIELMDQCGFEPTFKKKKVRFKIFIKPNPNISKYYWGEGGKSYMY